MHTSYDISNLKRNVRLNLYETYKNDCCVCFSRHEHLTGVFILIDVKRHKLKIRVLNMYTYNIILFYKKKYFFIRNHVLDEPYS